MPASDDFWLEHFSEGGRWSEGRPQELVDRALATVTDDVVEEVLLEFRANGIDRGVDVAALAALLRHWVCFTLDIGQSPDRSHAIGQRDAAKKLAPLLSKLLEELRAAPSGMSYALSQHSKASLRLNRSGAEWKALAQAIEFLEPAMRGLAEVRFTPGPLRDEALVFCVGSLLEIFEYVTGQRATRTYDVDQEAETSAFSAFVDRCLWMLHGDDAPNSETAIRYALKDRAERETSVTPPITRMADLDD